jgi:hypothetical protein
LSSQRPSIQWYTKKSQAEVIGSFKSLTACSLVGCLRGYLLQHGLPSIIHISPQKEFAKKFIQIFIIATDAPFSPIDIIAAQAPAIRAPALLPAIEGEIYSPPDHSVTAPTQTCNHHSFIARYFPALENIKISNWNGQRF